MAKKNTVNTAILKNLSPDSKSQIASTSFNTIIVSTHCIINEIIITVMWLNNEGKYHTMLIKSATSIHLVYWADMDIEIIQLLCK